MNRLDRRRLERKVKTPAWHEAYHQDYKVIALSDPTIPTLRGIGAITFPTMEELIDTEDRDLPRWLYHDKDVNVVINYANHHNELISVLLQIMSSQTRTELEEAGFSPKEMPLEKIHVMGELILDIHEKRSFLIGENGGILLADESETDSKAQELATQVLFQFMRVLYNSNYGLREYDSQNYRFFVPQPVDDVMAKQPFTYRDHTATFTCRKCKDDMHLSIVGLGDPRSVIQQARTYGWKVSSKNTVCPACLSATGLPNEDEAPPAPEPAPAPGANFAALAEMATLYQSSLDEVTEKADNILSKMDIFETQWIERSLDEPLDKATETLYETILHTEIIRKAVREELEKITYGYAEDFDKQVKEMRSMVEALKAEIEAFKMR